MYFVYILECADGTLYTGWTVDIDKRVLAHNESKTGAKYTSARRPVKLVYSESFETKSEAMKRECEVKKMSRVGKLGLIEKNKKTLL
jgi:putative endonuclease